MSEEKSWNGRTADRNWKITIRNARVFLELTGAGERYRNEVSLDQYFTEERRGGSFSLKEDVQHYAPTAVTELETEIQRHLDATPKA